MDLYRAVCDRDMEEIVAKLARAVCAGGDTWVKIKNPAYAQADERADFFDALAVEASQSIRD